MKRGRGRPAKKSANFQMGEYSDTNRKQEPRCSEEQKKRAAACSSIKETSKTSPLALKEKKPKIREMAAIAITRVSPDDIPPSRNLLDFVFHGADGEPLPIEASEVTEVFITSIIMPSDGQENEIEEGVRCQKFAQIQSWAISGYDEDRPMIWISTRAAKYRCVTPNRTYRKHFDYLLDKAWVCLMVHRELRESKDDILDVTLNELIAGVIRSLRGNERFAKRPADRDFVISIGEFIYKQLIKLDKASEVKLESVPALIALQEECKSEKVNEKPGFLQTGEGKDIESVEDSNNRLAKLLQEEEDGRKMRQLRTRQPAMVRNKFYSKANELEILSEYPSPDYYKPLLREMDEEFYESETDETDDLLIKKTRPMGSL